MRDNHAILSNARLEPRPAHDVDLIDLRRCVEHILAPSLPHRSMFAKGARQNGLMFIGGQELLVRFAPHGNISISRASTGATTYDFPKRIPSQKIGNFRELMCEGERFSGVRR
jgi:hypothetical protein